MKLWRISRFQQQQSIKLNRRRRAPWDRTGCGPRSHSCVQTLFHWSDTPLKVWFRSPQCREAGVMGFCFASVTAVEAVGSRGRSWQQLPHSAARMVGWRQQHLQANWERPWELFWKCTLETISLLWGSLGHLVSLNHFLLRQFDKEWTLISN